MDGRAPDVRQAKCAKTCAIDMEKPERRGAGAASGGPLGATGITGAGRVPAPHSSATCQKLPIIGPSTAPARTVPRDFAQFRSGARVSSAVADRCPDGEPGAGGGAGALARDPGKGARLAQQGDAEPPPTDYIRSIIALPKPEQETCVAPCISRAKS